MTDSDIQYTFDWFKEAYRDRPSTPNNISTQLGVHFEEIAEMLDSISGNNSKTDDLIVTAQIVMEELAAHFKQNDDIITIENRVEFLDSLCDQIVTAVGCGYHTKMNIVDAIGEVNRSNFSKFDENGRAVLDENQKVAKSINYRRADLTRFV